EVERRQLVDQWNQREIAYGETRSVPEIFAGQARLRGEAIALKSEQGELSYGELDRRANQLGNYLTRMRVGREDLIAIYADRSVETVIAMLGVLKMGAAYLPLDVNYPEDRMSFILEDASVKVLLTKGESSERLAGKELTAEVIALESHWGQIAEEREDSPDVK